MSPLQPKQLFKAKRTILALLIAVAILGLATTMRAELRLSDKPVAETNLEVSPKAIYEALTIERAMKSHRFVRNALVSFTALTERTSASLSKAEKDKIGNLSWETQHLGLTNRVNIVEGTLKKQDYLIKKLEYELAKERLGTKKNISAVELERMKTRYESAERGLEKYLNNYRYAD